MLFNIFTHMSEAIGHALDFFEKHLIDLGEDFLKACFEHTTKSKKNILMLSVSNDCNNTLFDFLVRNQQFLGKNFIKALFEVKDKGGFNVILLTLKNSRKCKQLLDFLGSNFDFFGEKFIVSQIRQLLHYFRGISLKVLEKIIHFLEQNIENDNTVKFIIDEMMFDRTPLPSHSFWSKQFDRWFREFTPRALLIAISLYKKISAKKRLREVLLDKIDVICAVNPGKIQNFFDFLERYMINPYTPIGEYMTTNHSSIFKKSRTHSHKCILSKIESLQMFLVESDEISLATDLRLH